MMSKPVVDIITNELKALRRRRGIYSDPIRERAGTTLLAACGVTPEDGSVEVRRKISVCLLELISELPDDLGIAVTAALALTPEARQPFYQERMRWAAQRLDRDERTVSRRANAGIAQLAEQIAAQLVRKPGTDRETVVEKWHTTTLRTILNLTLSAPEAFEFRHIVADQDDLREIDLAVTLTPPPPGARSQANGLAMDVLFGGSPARRTMESTHRFGMVLTLPKPLNRGEEHEFGLRFRLPEGQPMNPHFVCVPRQSCEELEIRVKFDEKKLPTGVWRLTGVFQSDLDDPSHRMHQVRIDKAAELCVRFDRPKPGFAYGVQWDDDPDPDGSPQM